jgi:hypothetical protein
MSSTNALDVRPTARRSFGPLLSVYGISLLLILLTRWPLLPEHLYNFDSANLALAMREFDPARHQPQPPGYPFFVAESRFAALVWPEPERVFGVLAIVIGSLALASAYWMGRSFDSHRTGLAAAGLLFANPIFWYTGLTSPLRLHAALISLLTAWCCWRVVRGESRYLYAASLVLGLGGGFRPVAAVALVPLWGWCAWKYADRRVVLRSASLLSLGTLMWLIPVVWAYGGWGPMLETTHNYLLFHSQSAAAFSGLQLFAWRRMIGRALLWNGLGAALWLPVVPFVWSRLRGTTQFDVRLGFLAAWFVPHFLINALVHLGSPAHTVATVSATCVAGGLVLEAASRQRGVPWRRAAALGGMILSLKLALFFWPRQVPQANPTTAFRGLASVRDAVSIGVYETSYSRVRYRDNRTAAVLSQIEKLRSGTDRPLLLIWAGDAIPVWRKLCYYFPSVSVYELIEDSARQQSGIGARLWQGNETTAVFPARAPVRLPVPAGARLIWIIPTPTAAELNATIPLHAAGPVYYTDLPARSAAVRWRGFEFFPEGDPSAATPVATGKAERSAGKAGQDAGI